MVEADWGSGYSRAGANIPMTIHAALFSPSFLWKEVPRRGGGWPRETVLPHSGKPTPPRFARLPLPEEGARMFFKEILITSLSFAVSDSRFPPHMPRCSAFLICLSCRLCPIRPCGAPSPRGEGGDTRIPPSKKGGEAATFIPNSSFEQSFHSGSRDNALWADPEPSIGFPRTAPYSPSRIS
mgnify:CR=1 FL=1